MGRAILSAVEILCGFLHVLMGAAVGRFHSLVDLSGIGRQHGEFGMAGLVAELIYLPGFVSNAAVLCGKLAESKNQACGGHSPYDGLVTSSSFLLGG